MWRKLDFIFVCIVLAGLVAFDVPPAKAQPGTWNAYPSLREVVGVTSSGNEIWAATGGGVYSYTPENGEVRRFTPVNGLYGVDTRAIVYDEPRNAIWVGYGEGVLDKIDVETGDVQSFRDISRAEQFTDKSINRLRSMGDTLYVATAFGLVVFDLEREEVRETYSNFGILDPATSTWDVLHAPLPDSGGDGIWVATSEGVVYAEATNPNLQQPSAWTLDPETPTETRCLALYENMIHVGTLADAYRREPTGTWSPFFFTGAAFSSLTVFESSLLGVSQFRIFRRDPSVGVTRISISGLSDLRGVSLIEGGGLWAADGLDGLGHLAQIPSETGNVDVEPDLHIIPTGPFSNTLVDIAVSSEELWISHARVRGRVGISRLAQDAWQSYSNTNGMLPEDQRLYESATVDSEGTFYAGSRGDGLTRITTDGTVTIFDETNSSLVNTTGQSEDFVIVGDVAEDASGNIWVTNKGAVSPIHVLPNEGDWTALPYPPGVPSSIAFESLVVDSFNQKWITTLSPSLSGGRGLVAFDSGEDIESPVDDQGLHIANVGPTGVGLPNEEVKALAFDLDGVLWIGTARGLATIFSPGSAFGGDPSLVQPQWTRTEDGSSFFLRDLNINDIAVDPANQKWLASSTGAWLISAEGDEVLLNFNTENSPLFSKNVVAVDVDMTTGRVYLATESGLLSYDGEATAPALEVQDLSTSPSPYRPDVHSNGVLITGLVADTQVRIVTLDGQRIATLEGQGGSVRWDGRDDRTGDLVSSGIYLVSAIAENGEGTAHGKIAVIR